METLIFAETSSGMALTCRGRRFRLTYPRKIWQAYPRPAKDVLADNLAHLLTISMPLVSGAETVRYNTPVPLFKPMFDSMAIEGIPGAVEGHRVKTHQSIRQFLNVNHIFERNEPRPPSARGQSQEKAIVALSCGKDSLLSLAVCHELGLRPVPVYVDETLSAPVSRMHRTFLKRLSHRFGFDPIVVTNEIEQLNHFATWGRKNSGLGRLHRITGLCLLLTPIAHCFKARYIVLGNEQNMNFGFLNKDGYWAWPSFEQTRYWTTQQSAMVNMLSGGATSVISVVEPLTNIAIKRVLFHEYPEFAHFLSGCDRLDGAREKRWCHNCSRCAMAQILIRAAGADPRQVGFRRPLLDRRHKRFYRLFDGRDIDNCQRTSEARDEELLAFFLAWQNGTTGPLMLDFEKELLTEAMEREDDLQKRFFVFHDPVTIPPRLRGKILTFYEREFLRDR